MSKSFWNKHKGILHWSKELRIKNTTRRWLPVKVAIFIFYMNRESCYVPCMIFRYSNLKQIVFYCGMMLLQSIAAKRFHLKISFIIFLYCLLGFTISREFWQRELRCQNREKKAGFVLIWSFPNQILWILTTASPLSKSDDIYVKRRRPNGQRLFYFW